MFFSRTRFSQKNLVPIVAAVSLVFLWTGMIFAIPWVMGLFTDFKIELSVLTRVTVRVSQLFGGMVLPLAVIATALLLGFRQFVGWVYALVLCVAWDLALVGLILPVVALINNLSGGSGSMMVNDWLSLFTALGSLPGMLAVGAFLINQALFILLVVKRRDFAR
jgi:hypothetical protein